MAEFTFDANNNLNVDVVAGGGTNPSVSPTGTPVPGSATFIGFQDISGNLDGVSVATPLPENIVQWGSTPVTAAETASTIGNESAPVVRSTPRKYGQIITTTPLAANGIFTSAWFDTNSSGGTWVYALSFSNVASSSLGFTIQVSNDTTNTNTQFTLGTVTAPANNLTVLEIQISTRYWRVVYTNGATLQTTFELTSTEFTTVAGIVAGQNVNAGLGSFLSPVTVTSGAASTNLDVALLTAQNPAGDGLAPFALVNSNGSNSIALAVSPYLQTGTGGSANNVLQRTPAVFKTVQATALGNTAVWTPAAGKKFRLMRFKVQLTANSTLAAAGVLTVSFQDSATGIPLAHDFYVGQVALTAATALFTPGEDSGWIDLGNGIASALANNVLNVNLSVALASGNIRVICCGTEE